jgi:cytochrome c2
MKKYTELIDTYLSGEMGPGERADFEKGLETDRQLKAEFDRQTRVLQGIESFAIKSEMSKGLKRKAHKIKAGRWLAAITIATLLVLMTLTSKEEAVPVEIPAVKMGSPEPEPLKREERNAAATAAENKEHSRDMDTLSGHGSKELGKISFVWSQAKGNLPQEIAAGPFVNTKNNLSKTKTKPVKKAAEKAAVFSSNRQTNGRMDWANLGSQSQGRVLADSLALEAYNRYLQDTVKNAGLIVKDKKLADSLYRSFRRSAAAKEFLGKDTAGVVFLAIVEKPVKRATGAVLFRQNCASCHSLGTEKVKGPGMAGVINRVPGGDWLFSYILNSQKMISSGNAYANKIYEEHGRKAMTVFEGKLSGSDIRSIIEFLGQQPTGPPGEAR